MTNQPHRVSLILTIKNEAESLPPLLRSIAAQTRPPDEVIVVDGGSSDDSVHLLEDWRQHLPLTVILAPGVNISEGRNRAAMQATGDIIAVTDGGVVLDSNWLARLVEPFSRPFVDQPDVVSGFFQPAPESFFESVLAATTLPDEVEINPERFLPSSRSVALRASLFQAGARYPEWLDFCEDLVFDLRLLRAGARFRFQPSAIAWFRPRATLSAYFRQYYLYARGDGKAGLFLKRHLVRYATYLVFLPVVLIRRDRGLLALAAVVATLYMRRPWQRLLRSQMSMSPAQIALAPPLAVLLRLVGDGAKMAGYPAGLIWRHRRYGLRRGWSRIPESLPTIGIAMIGDQRVPEELSGQQPGSPSDLGRHRR